ncbi:MAG: tetratricopeptide repeat protein [Aquificaceae bacterium]
MKIMALAILFALFSCAGVSKEEIDKRFALIDSKIAQLDERQKAIEDRNVRIESRLDIISESLSTTRLELERLKAGRDRQQSQGAIIAPERPQTQTQTQQTQVQMQTQMQEHEKLYEEALKLYNFRQLNQAKEKFIDYIKRFPATNLTDNAYMWLGVVYRDLGEINKAEAVWLTLVEKCKKSELPDCNKAPGALMQLAGIFERRADIAKAREFYEMIINDYPLSEEAKAARARLGR